MPDRDAEATGTPTFAALLESRYDELRQFALRRGGSPSLADDVMQDAWLRLSGERATRADSGGIGNPLAYVYRVVANLVIDRQRQGMLHDRHFHDDAPADQVATPAPSPFRVVAGQQEYALLQEAIRALPPKCREVFLLYRAEHLTMRQIAERLAISPKTVENHIAHAMLACRRRVKSAGTAT